MAGLPRTASDQAVLSAGFRSCRRPCLRTGSKSSPDEEQSSSALSSHSCHPIAVGSSQYRDKTHTSGRPAKIIRPMSEMLASVALDGA
ncbi:hypothetical protein J6590_003303 [Homalodisca vitripennis]|nr:hypothetical protein J6590_099999 [Homalodisca vitripennis]KAG8294130.1 hypothetical protein J6590_003303 [Homalodisca vitripennis]